MKFGKIFEQMYDSSIADDWRAMVTFQQLIVLSRDGVVDATPRAIAARTRLPEDIIVPGLEALGKPDPESRSKAEDGRRIVPLIDEDGEPRPWGWRIVNHLKYYQKISDEERRAYKTEKQREYRARDQSMESTSVHGGQNVDEGGPSGHIEKKREIKREREIKNEKETETEKKTPASPVAPVGAIASERTMSGSLSVYAIAWEARYSSPPHPSARDCIAANAALKTFEPAIRAQLLAAYVADEDPWLCEKAHPLGLFPRQIDKLRARLNGKLSHGVTTARYVNPTKGFQEPGYNRDLDVSAIIAAAPRTVEE